MIIQSRQTGPVMRGSATFLNSTNSLFSFSSFCAGKLMGDCVSFFFFGLRNAPLKLKLFEEKKGRPAAGADVAVICGSYSPAKEVHHDTTTSDVRRKLWEAAAKLSVSTDNGFNI
jgi:hypothetical protein